MKAPELVSLPFSNMSMHLIKHQYKKLVIETPDSPKETQQEKCNFEELMNNEEFSISSGLSVQDRSQNWDEVPRTQSLELQPSDAKEILVQPEEESVQQAKPNKRNTTDNLFLLAEQQHDELKDQENQLLINQKYIANVSFRNFSCITGRKRSRSRSSGSRSLTTSTSTRS